MFKKTTFFILSSIILWSCSSQQNATSKNTPTKAVKITQAPNVATTKRFPVRTNHYPAVGQNERVRFVVLHYTALGKESSLRVLTQQQVSSHYLVTDDRNPAIYMLVKEDKRAWHAGKSDWRHFSNLNDTSIGIEIVNPGYKKQGGREIFYAYPPKQIEAVAELVKNIMDRYKVEPQYVIGHSDIAPQRKQDPGAKFPWRMLYDRYGIGAWFDYPTKDYYQKQFPYSRMNDRQFILDTQKDFEKYGYKIETTGVWDAQTKSVIKAFQYHFRPAQYGGKLDAETWAILKALNQKYRSK